MQQSIIATTFYFNHRIDLYFPRHKLAIEVDEKGHQDRDKRKEIERENDIKEYLDCKFIKINPDEKIFDV